MVHTESPVEDVSPSNTEVLPNPRSVVTRPEGALSVNTRGTTNDLLVQSEWDREWVNATLARRVLKRGFDIVLAGLMLVAAAPVALILMAAIKIEDRGPVFYAQERWGVGGRRFRVRKFRSMTPEASSAAVIQAKEDDQRITRVGRLMRRMGLDEIPQFFHILVGHMSFVGPRALAVGEKVLDGEGREIRYEDLPMFAHRHLTRPGLTGMSAIYLPKDVEPAEKFAMDLVYIRHQSFLLDLKLVALSFLISFRGKWESRGGKLRPSPR